MENVKNNGSVLWKMLRKKRCGIRTGDTVKTESLKNLMLTIYMEGKRGKKTASNLFNEVLYMGGKTVSGRNSKK